MAYTKSPRPYKHEYQKQKERGEHELRMDYDNRVELDRLDFNAQSDLCDDIMRNIDNDFRVIDNEGNITTAV